MRAPRMRGSVRLEFFPVCGVPVIFRADRRPGWTGIHGARSAARGLPAPAPVLPATHL